MSRRLKFNYRTIIIIHLLFIALITKGQSNYLINGQVYLEKESPTGILVLQMDGNSLKQISPRSNGTFSTEIDWNKTYYFHFKKSGYVTKIIEFNTTVPKSKKKVEIEPYNLQVRLFKTFEGVDSMFFLNPVAKIGYSDVENDFDYDMDYSMMIKERIDKMLVKKKVDKSGEQNIKKMDVLPVSQMADARASSPHNEKMIKQGDAMVQQYQTSHKNALNGGSSSVIPPLKPFYTFGRTVEEFSLDKKRVTRIVIKDEVRQKVFLKVKHDWGATYYFLDESPLTTRCVSKSVFERETLTLQ